MLWLFFLISALTAEQIINLAFAVLCLALAAGMGPRAAAVVSALLYLALVMI